MTSGFSNPRGKEKTAQGDACAVAFVEPTQVRFEKSQRIVPVEQSHVRLISASFAVKLLNVDQHVIALLFLKV